MQKLHAAIQVGILFGIAFIGISCENTEDLRKGLYLKSIENCKQAIEHLEKYLSTNPKSIPNKVKAEENLAECLLSIADNEKQLKHWENGINSLQQVLDKYPETTSAERIEDIMPEYYFEWGAQLSNDGKFLESLQILKKLIMTFPASGFAQKGRELRNQIGIIAFNSGTDIYIMNSDGGKLRKVATSAIDATLSPDGTKIAYIKVQKPTDKQGFLYLADIDGRRAKQLLDNPVASEPNFSPDGSSILISKGDAFQKVDLTGKTINAYFDIVDFDTIGDFSPDGKNVVAFKRNIKGPKDESKLVTTSDFEEYIELTISKEEPIRDAAWSKDNLRLVYATSKGLYTISPEGEDLSEFLLSETLDGMDIRSVDISPTGTDVILIGKKKSDADYRLYYVTLTKEVAPIEIQPNKEGIVPPVSPGKVSWGYGYLKY